MMKEAALSGEHPDLEPPPKQKKENKKNKKNRTDEFDEVDNDDDVTPDEDVEKKQAVTERKPIDFDFSQFADDIAAASYYAAKEIVQYCKTPIIGGARYQRLDIFLNYFKDNSTTGSDKCYGRF